MEYREYRTESIQLASFLACQKDLNFINVDKSNPQRIAFIFSPHDKAQKLADEYFAGKARVNPLKLFEKYRTLKDIIFEVKTKHKSINNIKKRIKENK